MGVPGHREGVLGVLRQWGGVEGFPRSAPGLVWERGAPKWVLLEPSPKTSVAASHPGVAAGLLPVPGIVGAFPFPSAGSRPCGDAE